MLLDLDAREPRLDHLGRLYRVARARTGSADEADGLVQDTHGPDLLVALRHAFADTRDSKTVSTHSVWTA